MRIIHTEIADIKFQFVSKYCQLPIALRDYKSDFSEPDVTIEVFEEEILKARSNDEYKNIHFHGYYEEKVAFKKLSVELPKFNAFVLHGALISVHNSGVVFCAPSGTGKTTHMMLWKKLLDDMVIINGDKPIVRIHDDKIYGYGTPWNGKEHLGCNSRVLIKHICFIERSLENEVIPLNIDVIPKLLANQMAQPADAFGVLKNMQFIDSIMNSCSFWKIKCNMEIDAARTSIEKIIGFA